MYYFSTVFWEDTSTKPQYFSTVFWEDTSIKPQYFSTVFIKISVLNHVEPAKRHQVLIFLVLKCEIFALFSTFILLKNFFYFFSKYLKNISFRLYIELLFFKYQSVYKKLPSG